MLKRYLSQPIWAVWLAVFLLFSLALAACGGAAAPVTEEAASATELEKATETQADIEEVEETNEVQEEVIEDPDAAASEDETPAEEAEAPQPDENLLRPGSTDEATCHTVDIPDNQRIAAVSDSDWIKGPPDASVTVVEYGDFQ